MKVLNMKKAIGYIRVSGKGQLKGDGFARQIKAIKGCAKKKSYELVKIYKEKGVSGTLKSRPALSNMIMDISKANSDIDLILIERVDRLARDLMIQENIINDIKKQDVHLISVTDGDLLEDDPTRKLVRQVLGAIAEYDKTMTVLKLRAARQRKKELTGKKVEGAKSTQELKPDLIQALKKLRRKPRNGKRLSLFKIAESLNQQGFTTAKNKMITVSNIKGIIYNGGL